MADPQVIGQTLQYGPQAAQYVQRSKYLEDALGQLQQSSQEIKGGYGDLAARLAASYLLNKSRTNNNTALTAALQGDQSKANDALTAGLDGQPVPGPGQGAMPTPGVPPSTPAPPPMAPPIASAPSDLASALGAQGGQPPPAAPSATPSAPPSQLETALTGLLGADAGKPYAPSGAPSDVSPSLWGALTKQESGNNQSAVSPKGAFGVAQLMPGTAQDMATQLGNPALANQARTDPAVNNQLGQTYLSDMQKKYGDQTLALAAYNAGPGRVDQWLQQNGDPRTGQISPAAWAAKIPIPETRDYVAKLAGLGGEQAPAAPPSAPPMQYAPMGSTPPPGPQGQAPMGPPPMPQQQGQMGPGGPPQAQGPGQPTLGPAATPQEIAYVKQLLANPMTRNQGAAMAMQLQERMRSPQKMEYQMVNGVPVGLNPYDSQHPQSVPVPQATNSRIMTAEQLGVQAAPGTYFSVDPNGKATPLQAPPAGYGMTANGMAPMRGGADDPNAPQNQSRTLGAGQASGAGFAPGTVVQQGPKGERSVLQQPEYGPAQLAELRGAVLKSDEYKNARESMNAYAAMQQNAGKANGMSAYAMRDTFARAINPGAVARAGTIEAIKQAQGIPAQLQSFFLNLKGDGNMPPEIQQQVLDATLPFVQANYRGAAALNESNGAYAQRHGVDPRDVQAPLENAPQRFVLAPPQAAPPPQPGTQAAAIAEARRRGLMH